ncbi:MAG: hypothetical protein ACI88Z_001236, partial [Sphingobacteriales bacterium]
SAEESGKREDCSFWANKVPGREMKKMSKKCFKVWVLIQ